MQLNGALGLGEQIQLQAVATNEDMYNYRLDYQMALGPWSTRVGAGLSHLDYALDEEFSALNAYGSAKVASVHAIQPLVRSRGLNLNARLQFDQKRLTDHTAVCQPGVVTKQLQNVAEEKGLYYPVDFASSGSRSEERRGRERV